MLKSKYGDGYGRGAEFLVSRGSGVWSTWWRDNMKLTHGEEGLWFQGSVIQDMGNGRSIRLWDDAWVGGNL